MVTNKQKKSIDQVGEVFKIFYREVLSVPSMISTSDAVHGAAQLTKIYFENHEADGTPCGEVKTYDEE